MAVKKVLVVGAGIGGLTLAAALGQRGIEADVVEISVEQQVLGVGILQPGNALRALDSIGVLDACYAAGFPTDEYRYMDASGAPIATLQLLRIADPRRPAINMLPRPALHRILTDAAKSAGARIRMELTVRTLQQDERGANAVFTDGSRGAYDLVVGADGIRSSIRRMVFGETEPQFTGHGVWRVTTARPKELTYQAMYLGVAAKAGLVPLTQDTMYLLLVTNEPGNPRMPQDQLDRLIRERLAQFGGLIADVRERIDDPRSVVYGPIEEIILPPPWYNGRVVVIGDAAHASGPHIAQGAAMAIEDAVVLAELAASPMSVPEMLDAFMRRRYERCKFVQDTSRQVGVDGNLDDPAQCLARNERYRRMFADPQPRPHELRLAQPI